MNQAREEWEEQRWEELREVKALATESAKTVADNAQRKCLEVFVQAEMEEKVNCRESGIRHPNGDT